MSIASKLFHQVNFQIVLLGVCRAFSSESSCLRVERLKNRSVLSLSGQDSLGFLQETSTNDIKRLQEGRNGLLLMFLNARGHVLHDALAYRVGGSEVWLECDSSSLEALQTHLWMCRKNKRLQMRSLEDELSVWAVFREDGEEVGQPLPLRPELLAFRDPRLPQLGLRVLAPLGLDLGRQLARSGLSVVQAPSGLHDRLRYCLGVGEGAKEIPYGKYSPWEVNCDFLDGLSSGKSGFIGEEEMVRLKRKASRRMMPVFLDLGDSEEEDLEAVVPPDSPVEEQDRRVRGPVGWLRGSRGSVGLGLLRVTKALGEARLRVAGLLATSCRPPWWPASGL